MVIDERTKKPSDRRTLIRGIVAIYKINSNYFYEFGYFKPDNDTILLYNPQTGDSCHCISKLIHEDIMFSKKTGFYMIKPERLLARIEHAVIKGHGAFPYGINREYEAAKNLNNFKGAQKIISEDQIKFSEYLKYTFGLEFETSEGYVPQDMCFRDGLIPLRDGSITGIEYSTVVLEGNKGLNLLRQQCETLKDFTEFNKNCALHIHFGGYPINEKFIFVLYRILYYIQFDIEKLIPPYSFYTGKYKDNGKEYCAPLPFFYTFNDLYNYMSDGRTRYTGNLYQCHPDDLDHEHKWQIHSRYHNFNFVNMLFYDGAKTLELRFLRPSFNFNKILLWIYIFNAILLFAENESRKLTLADIEADEKKYSRMGLLRIFEQVYPDDLVEYLTDGVVKLKCIVKNQVENGDMIGECVRFEDKIFK